MKHSETAELLARIQSFNNRTVGHADVVAWQAVLFDEPSLTDAIQAVVLHFRDSKEWLMPSDIRRLTKKVRETRAASLPPAAIPDANPDDVPAYLRAVREQRMIDPGTFPKRHMRVIDGTFKSVPK